jgi:hypothetical protein
MTIEAELQQELHREDRVPSQSDQITKHEQFRARLARAGYVPVKKPFTIPLMERIGVGYLRVD